MDTQKAQEIAKFWSDVLNIKTEKIEIIFFQLNQPLEKNP